MTTWYLQFDFSTCGSGTQTRLYYGVNSYTTLHAAGSIQIPCSAPDKEAYARDYLIEYLRTTGLTELDSIFVNGVLFYEAPPSKGNSFLLLAGLTAVIIVGAVIIKRRK